MSQILDRYLRLWLYDQAFGFFAVNSKVIRLAFNALDDKKIEEIGRVGAEVHKKIIVYLYGKVNKTTVLNYLPIFCSRFDSYKHHVEGSVHTIAVFQEINVQFSKSYYKIMETVLAFGKIRTIDSAKDITEDGFSISFDTQLN